LDDREGGGTGGGATEDLILRTVAAHADSLLRTARRFSLCPDDAQDAYQRALEIFMRHAERLDAARAAGWLHVVVKREAQAIRRSRQRLVASDDVDFDTHEARSIPTPDERLASFDRVARSAEALQRLKPQELRALWLRAQGHSYNDISAMTGWSYTKVNRCLTEGRRSFIERYAEIESGAECQRWLPVISALVDGEATSEQLIDLRPHLRNCPACRATLRALNDSSEPLAAILPIPLAIATAAPDAGEQVSSLLTRIYEMVAGGLHDRAATSFTKIQAVVETTAAGKAAAIAGAAAAVAGGGYATMEKTVMEGRVERPVKSQRLPVSARPAKDSTGGSIVASTPPSRRIMTISPRDERHGEFLPMPNTKTQSAAPEFGTGNRQLRTATFDDSRDPTSSPRAQNATAPEFVLRSSPARSPEFRP
jgi:RNA polymerase sigma factor (sigma-70 family)